MSVTPKENIDSDEINIGSVWLMVVSFFFYYLKKWWVFVIFGLTTGALGLLISIYVGKTYCSNLSFTAQSQMSSSLSSILSISSSLGLTKGSSGGFDNAFFSKLILSNVIVKNSFLQKGIVDSKKDILANHFLKVYEWYDDWEDVPRLANFKFKTTDITKMTHLEDSVMTLIYDYAIDKIIVVTYLTDDPDVICSVTTWNEGLSRNLTDNLYSEMNRYYIDNIYDKNYLSFQVAQHQVDSLSGVLRSLDNKIAAFRDYNTNVIKQTALIELEQMVRDQQMLSLAYSSAVNNLELVKVNMAMNFPTLQIIDSPKYSTFVMQIKPVIAILIGGFLGGFLCFCFLTIRKLVMDSLRKKKLNEPQAEIA